MRMLWRRRARHVLVGCLVAAATVGTVSTAPAAADTPTVTVTPSRATSGQTVTVTASGFPSGDFIFVQCPAWYAGSNSPHSPLEDCRAMSRSYKGVPASIDGTVLETFRTETFGDEIDCAAEPGGCIVGVVLTTSAGDKVEAWAPIEFWDVGVEPRRALADGDTVAVTADGLGDGAWAVAQCAAAYAAAGDPAQAASGCGPATEVTAVGGSITTPLVVHDPLVATDGTSHDCGYTGCVVVIARPGEAPTATGPISFGPPSFAVEPAGPITRDQPGAVTIRVAGMPGTVVYALLCPEGTTSTDDCDAAGYVPLDIVGAASVPSHAMDGILELSSGTYDCGVEPCVLSVVAGDGQDALATVPVTFKPPPEMTLTPGIGLLDGQEIGVEVANLPPDTTYFLMRCSGPRRCEPPVRVVSSTTGVVTTTATVRQTLFSDHCRNRCYFALWTVTGLGEDDPFGGEQVASNSYAMAEGSTAVTPATGLVDGQEVQVTGTDLMPTYAGQQLGPWPTGGWALTQCDASIVGGLSLYSAFNHCAVPPVTRAVTIEGPAFDAPITVASSFTTFLGRQVDCTTAPGTCVVGLYRFEQDASSTGHFTPITFGSG